MDEKLQEIIGTLRSIGASEAQVQSAIDVYNKETSRGESSKTPESDKGPTLDADGIEVDSYVNNTFWDSTGIDRDSYFDEEGNFVEKLPSFSSQPDLGYEQVAKELKMKELLYRDATTVEETSTERGYNVTEEDEGDFKRSAETTYQDYIDIHNPIEEVNYFYHEQASLDANGNVTKKLTRTDTYGDQKMATEIDRGTEYLHEGMNVVPGETPIERENRLIELWTTMGNDMAAGRRRKPAAFTNQVVDGEGYADWRMGRAKNTSDSMYDPLLASNIYSGYIDGESKYFAEKIMIAKQQYAADNDGEKIEEAVGPNNINDPKFEDLKVIFDGISLDDPRLKAAVVRKEERGNRSDFIKDQASAAAEAMTSAEGVGKSLGQRALNMFFKSDLQENVAGHAEEDFEQIEEAARKKGVEAGLIHAHYNEAHENFTATVKELEGYGDAKKYIESIKAKHDLTTNEGIAAANVEITDFIDTYTGLVSDYNSGLNAVKDASLAATQIQEELGDLSIREQDLAAFTNQIGKNHRTATQMALAFGNATVDLAQGAGDFVYLVNPLGALADELVDYAGDDSFLGTVVEVARYTTAPATGGISLYSGGRRDDVKEAIDGYQEHVSSLVTEPPRYEDIQNVEDAIEWGLITGASQAPQLALLAATGGNAGLIMMGAMAAGQKFSAMEDERELFQKTAGLYGQDYTFATMYAASMGSGVIETLSERVTLGLMKGGGGMVSNALLKDVGRKTMGSFFRRNIFSGDALKYSTKKLIDIGEEGGSEVLATMGGNYIDRLTGDKTVNILSGVEESFVTGALIGSTISMPSVFRDIHSSFKSVEAADILSANYAKIQEQNAIINDPNSPEYAKETANALIGELVAQNAEVIAIDVKRVDSLTNPEKERLVDIETENRKLTEQYLEVIESDMSEADKTAQIEALNEVYNKNLNAKHSIISQYPPDKVLRDHKQQMDMLEAEAEAVREAGGEINTTIAKSKTNEGVRIEFDAWKKEAEKKGNVRIAASEDGTQIYGAMTAVTNEAGEVVSYEIFMNEKNIFEDGKTTTASHELLHAAMFNTIRANPVLRRRFGEAIERILDGPGVKISPKARKDLDRVMQYGKTARGEELFAIVSENMVSGGITIDAGALGKMKDLMRRTSMSTTDVDIEFNDDQDIRNFLKDYSRSRAKGTTDRRVTSLFVKGAKGKLVEAPATRDEAKKIVEERHEEQAVEDLYSTLMASMRANPDMMAEIDDLVKNPDGSPKFESQSDFMNQAGAEAYMKIVESPVLNGLVQQGMTELGLPPQALREFTRKVKEKLGERLLLNYDVTKNDSLFGWLTGVSGGAGKSIIYRAKGDVMNEYKREGELETVSLDAQIGESTTFEAMIEAETDVFMEQLDEMDMTKSREAQEARKPKKVVNELNVDNKGKANVKQAVVGANIDIEGVQYKDVKKLTTSKNAPLSKVLEVIAGKFGVDPKRIVKPSDLDGKQRKSAQEFIGANADFLLEMLPEGETVSGEATGIANTKLGELYEKGERLKFKDGATAAGKFSQQKKSGVTAEQFKELFGIKPDGTFDNNRKYDGAIKALVNQATVLAANQALRENAMENGTSSEAVIAKLGEGRAEIMFSHKPKNENTFVQLYPDLIMAVAKVNPGSIEAVTAVVEKVYGNTTENIKKISKEVWETVGEFNKTKKKTKSVGVELQLDLAAYLDSAFIDQQSEKGIFKRFTKKFGNSTTLEKNRGLFVDENGKAIPIGKGKLDYDRAVRERGSVVLIGKELLKRGHSPERVAEILLSHFKPMYSGAAKVADGRFTGVDGVLMKTPGWLFNIRDVGSTIATIKSLSDAGVIELAKDMLGDAYNDGPVHTVIGGILNEIVVYGGDAFLDADSIDTSNQRVQKLRKALIAQVKKQGEAKNRKQVFSSVEDLLAVINTVPGLGQITKIGNKYHLDSVLTSVLGDAGIHTEDTALNTTLKSEKSEVVLNEWASKDDVKREESWNTRKQQAMDAREAVEVLNDVYYREINDPNSSYDALDWAMAITAAGSNMSAPMRRSAYPEYQMEGIMDVIAQAKKDGISVGKVTEFEHMQTQEETAGMILDSYFENGVLDEAIWDNYRVSIISKDMDNAQTDAGWKFKSPPSERGDSRPFSMEAIGDTRVRPLQSMDPAKRGTRKEFIGREWVMMNDAMLGMEGMTRDEVAAMRKKFSSIQNLQGAWTSTSFSKRGEKPKGASIWDFDDTLATTKSNVLYTTPEGVSGELNAEEFARDYVELAGQGYEFDFSEFDKVVGGKPGPLFDKAVERLKKFGPDGQFILTARNPEAQEAIYEFLKGIGLNIPPQNIVGLGNSTGQAKADWIAENLIQNGYNDLYFADDAMQNVEAVKAMFDLFDVKGKVQQARVEFSKRAPKKMAEIIDESALDIDTILEQTKGVGREKGFSAAKAKQRGKGKGKFKFFLPPSAEDFAGLIYSFLGKGKQGEKHHAWFKENLFDPYSKGIRQINTVKQLVAKDMRSLRRALPKVKKVLKNTVPGTEYTHEQAIRVYNWARAGMDIPGLSKTDQKKLVDIVKNDSQLKAFADGVNSIAATPGGLQAPTDSWLAGTIPSDMNDAMDASRERYLEPWLHNKNVIFSEQALNKIEAVYGSNFREALEDVLYRMEYNSNRASGQGRLLGGFMDWINGSIGATMFFNSRSAVLQTMSSVNFINWSDNNPLKAAAAFANQKQYWADVAMIFNSPFLKQRRSGLAQDVNTAELAEAVKGATNPARAAIGYLLQLGFTPTQIADSFAIASGGATMYRNRIKSLMEGGMTQKEAEAQAFTDFMEIAEETQQSARPDRISQQQASPLGKVILAFQNTPMQYNRLMKKAMLDLVNGRGDAKTHMSKILYYGAIQNAIFYSLQTALYAMLFGDDDEDEEERQEAMDKKTSRVVNGMIDGLLRGAGIGGAVVSTLKNVVLEHLDQKKKLDDDKFYTDYQEGEVIIELLNLSPPIGIKARKISSGLKTWLYNRDVIAHMPKTDIDNPIYDATFSITEGLTNVPLSRAHGKLMNLREAANSDHETWKRVSMFLGWNKWSFGIQNQDVLTAKGEVKAIKAVKAEEKREKKKEEKAIEKAEENKAIEQGFLEDQKAEIENKKKDDKIKCAAVTSSGKRCGKNILKGQSYCTIHESVEQNKTGEKTQCKHTKKDGKRCKVKTANKSGLCYYHD